MKSPPMLLLRMLAAWLWTILMSTGATLSLFSPAWAWLTFCQRWARTTLRIIGVTLDVEGGENLRGPAVFVSNHQSLIDVILLPAILPRTVKLVAKKELSRIPLWGWALSRSGGVMIDRKNPRGAIASIREALEGMPEGWSVGVFPEGTRSRDGELQRFKKGAFHIALQRRLPVVPIGIEGTRNVMPKGAWLPRPASVRVTIGEPIDSRGWSQETLELHVREGHDAVRQCLARSRQRVMHTPSLMEIQASPN